MQYSVKHKIKHSSLNSKISITYDLLELAPMICKVGYRYTKSLGVNSYIRIEYRVVKYIAHKTDSHAHKPKCETVVI